VQALNPIDMYKKLPAHGDFISRELSTSFIRVWDEWLQGIFSESWITGDKGGGGYA